MADHNDPNSVNSMFSDIDINGATLSLLAECLHRAGRTTEALSAVEAAEALGAGDPRLRSRARAIRRAASGGR